MCQIDILSIFSLVKNDQNSNLANFFEGGKNFWELATFKYLPLPVAYRAIAVRRARWNHQELVMDDGKAQHSAVLG